MDDQAPDDQITRLENVRIDPGYFSAWLFKPEYPEIKLTPAADQQIKQHPNWSNAHPEQSIVNSTPRNTDTITI